MAKLLKKLSSKAVSGNIKKIVQATKTELVDGIETTVQMYKEDDEVKLLTIFGTANDVKTGQGAFGEWVAFQGQFEAINAITGEEFTARQCHLPEPWSAELHGQLKTAKIVEAEGGAMASLEFAIHVNVIVVIDKDDQSIGYEYRSDSAIKQEPSPALSRLRALAMGLPAPEETKAVEEPKAPTKKTTKK